MKFSNFVLRFLVSAFRFLFWFWVFRFRLPVFGFRLGAMAMGCLHTCKIITVKPSSHATILYLIFWIFDAHVRSRWRHRLSATILPWPPMEKVCGIQDIATCKHCCALEMQVRFVTKKILPLDTLAEWLRRRPAKPMGSPRAGSNPAGVALRRWPRRDIQIAGCHPPGLWKL